MTEINKNTVDPVLMELLCCPACKGESNLQLSYDSEFLKCIECQRKFTVKKVAGPKGQGLLIPDLILLDS